MNYLYKTDPESCWIEATMLAFIAGFQTKVSYSYNLKTHDISVRDIHFTELSQDLVKRMLAADAGFLEWLGETVETEIQEKIGAHYEWTDSFEPYMCTGHKDEVVV